MRALVLQHVAIEGPGTLASYLAGRGWKLETVALYEGARLPEDAQGYQAVIVMEGPNLKPARVTVTLKDGRQSIPTCESARGDFQRPYQASEMRAKFRELAALVLTPDGVTGIEQAVNHCDQWTSGCELTDQLRRYGRP